ncbi:MAG: cytochrome P450 [Myxococcota bacterium]
MADRILPSVSPAAVPGMPRDPSVDGTLDLMREGYTFIMDRCRQLGTDVFETRLMLKPVVCMMGAAAARLFYEDTRFERAGAAPLRLQRTLFGRGGVQGLDGEAHHHRKALFLSVLTPEGVGHLVDDVRSQWLFQVPRWARRDQVVLFDEVEEILCRAVCGWAGVPLPESDVARRTADLHALIDSPGALGPRHWRGRMGRARAERWMAKLVKDVRAHRLAIPDDSALARVASHRDLDGQLLTPGIAAVEVLNLLRPTVAVARWITFAALALHEHGGQRERIARGDDAEAERFAQEVRRYYPFFPFVAARVRQDFEWQGYTFRRGRRVLLDIYGTHHDPRSWARPGAFRPDRFLDGGGDPYRFLPQGTGNLRTGHRCPGDELALELTRVCTQLLVRSMRYTVPPQDLRVDLTRIPALPASGFVMRDVRAV